MRRRVARAGAVAVLGGVLLVGAVTGLRTPSLTRGWDDDVRVLAGVRGLDDGSWLLSDIRDWRYSRDTVVARPYRDRAYDPDDIAALWMYEQPLGAGGLIAHTFLVFDFGASYGEDRYLGLSVETRREKGEQYSLVGGLLRSFEVTHIWALERDLVIRRVEYLDYPLRRYRLTIPEEYLGRIFSKLVEETAELATEPRWYNTVLHNCTSSLIRYVNESEPDAIPLHYSYVLTGRVDEYLAELGYLDPASREEITREYLAREPLRSEGA